MSYAGTDFSAAGPTEMEIYTLDFSLILAPGETISTNTVALSVSSGTDATPMTRLSGAAVFTGWAVSQKIGPMLAGVTYILTMTVVTTRGQTLTLYSHIPCQAQT